MPAIEDLLATYPRRRPPLPPAYEAVYTREYLLNRQGGSRATRLAARAEAWMHRIVAANAIPGSVLEIGAGTLNHLRFEPHVDCYDVVEPFEALYASGESRGRVRCRYRGVEEVPQDRRYDRIVSIAVLEHLEQLPSIVAHAALLLAENGVAQFAIPSEGGALWGLGWRMTTGIGYWMRNRLSYRVAMRHEHINDAPEIIDVVRWFFEDVRIRRFPLRWHHASLYAYIEARTPRASRCCDYLRRDAH
jgi:hypothetical protein